MYKKFENETYEELLLRMVSEVKEPEEMSWVTFAKVMNEILEENYTESKYRKDYTTFQRMFQAYKSKNLESKLLEEIQAKNDKLEKNLMKFSYLKGDRKKELRAEAQTELFYELILERLKNLTFPKIVSQPRHTNYIDFKSNKGVLVISDAHYGKSFTLKGISGEIINSYSVEIFEKRMWNLLEQVKFDIEKMNITELEIIDNGDCIDGVLRTGSSLRKLEINTIDSILGYSSFIISWLIELYNQTSIPLTYSLTGGNHDLLRLLSSKKDFDDENVAKLIHKIISDGVAIAKLQSICDCEIGVSDYDNGIYRDIDGFKILAYHGESKNLKTDLHYFENFYNINIDMIVCGHLHSDTKETIGVGAFGDKQLIRVNSICGTDDFAKRIRENSKAGAKFFVFEYGNKTWERNYYLN